MGNRPIEDARRPHVVEVLKPHWRGRRETDRKLQIRVRWWRSSVADSQ
ncbi:MAG: hypothetical protein ACRC14_18750 [Paracoccaceae bacterium]